MAALLLTTLISVLIAAWQALATAREASAHRDEAFQPKAKASKQPPVVLAAQPEPPGSAGESLSLLETASEIELEKIQAQSTQVDRALKTRVAPSLRSKSPAAADGGSNSSEPTKKAARENLGLRFTRYAALMYFFNVSAWFYDIPFAVTIYTFFGTGHPALVAVALIRLIYGFIKTLLKTLLTPFNGVQTPLFSSLHAEGRDSALQTAYASLSKLQIFMLVPSGLGIIILARNLMFLLFERKSQDAVLTGDLLFEATWATALTVAFTFTEAIISLPMIVLMVYEKYRLVILSRCIPFLTGPLLILCAVFNWGAVNAVIVNGWTGSFIARGHFNRGAQTAASVLPNAIYVEGFKSRGSFRYTVRRTRLFPACQLAYYYRNCRFRGFNLLWRV